MPDYPDYLVKQILQNGGTDWDFELFCVRHYTQIEGFNYLPTSRNYDLGSDGRVVSKRGNGESYIIASMQEDRLEAKAISDLTKLLKQVIRPAKIRFCFTKLNTEHTRRRIERAARKLAPVPEIVVSGIDQLVEEIHRSNSAFEDTYDVPITEIRRQLESVDRNPQRSIRLGFRVLLAAQLNQNATALRRGILGGLILQSTKQGIAVPQSEILRAVAEAIGIQRPVEASYLADAIRELEGAGCITVESSGDIRRKAAASDQMNETAQTAASRALEGYGAFKRAVTQHFGESIGAADFKRIWAQVKSGLIRTFQRYGDEFVEFVYSLGESNSPLVPKSAPESPMDNLRKVSASLEVLELSLPQTKVRRLIHILPDALLDIPSGSRHWLTQLCLAYVSACSLGLHPDALKRMEVRLRTWDVLPDTHVILSVLGRGESDHSSITQLLGWWRNAGGKLIAIAPVLNETIRHAKLGEESVKMWAAKVNRRRGQRRRQVTVPTNNVFLRSAVAIYGEEVGPIGVGDYIRQFLAIGSEESANIRKILEFDFGFSAGPTLVVDRLLEGSIYERFAEMRLRDDYAHEYEAENAKARCRHDAASLAYLAAYRQSLSGQGRVAVILSHSTHLRNIHDAFRQQLGNMSPCIDPARLMFALSLSPGAQFTIASMQSALFGSAFQHQVKRHESLAKKVLDELASSSDDGLHTPTLSDMVDGRLTNSHMPRTKPVPQTEWP